MRRTTKRFLALVAMAAFSACSDSSGPNESVTGSYALISINTVPLPVVFFVDQFVTFRITSGNVTLNSNNTFSSSGTYQQTPAGGGPTTTATETCAGTYTMTGNAITFTEANSANPNCGGVYNGTWDGANTLTIAFGPTDEAVFRK